MPDGKIIDVVVCPAFYHYLCVMKDTLDMSVKTVFFEPIRNGAKTTEYRDFTEYWVNKLLDTDRYGKTPEDIINGLLDGSLEVIQRPYRYILFHESGHKRTVKVEMGQVRTYVGHRAFCIDLGKVVEDNGKKIKE